MNCDSLLERLTTGASFALEIKFGEILWVKNKSWSRFRQLSHLSGQEGYHPGLCIRPQSKTVAFGTSKISRVKRSKSRIFRVKKGSYPGAKKDGVFLLDYAIPITWEDCSWKDGSSILPENLRKQLAAMLNGEQNA